MPGIVVDHVTPAMALFREESFGSQVSIARVDSVEEAFKLASDSEYGLSAAVFTRDLALSIDVAKRIDSFTELRWITFQTSPRHYPF